MSLLYGSSWFAFYEHFYFEIETAMYTRLVYIDTVGHAITTQNRTLLSHVVNTKQRRVEVDTVTTEDSGIPT
jgi:hypothetical protein